MKFNFHWMTATVQNLTDADLDDLCRLFQVPLRLFSRHLTKAGNVIYAYSVPDSGSEESIFIRQSPDESCYSVITLKGSYWEYYPDFPVHCFRDRVFQKGGNFCRTDLCFDDDVGALSFEQIVRMSMKENCKDYIIGSLSNNRKKPRKWNDVPDSNNRKAIPDVHLNHEWIQYGDTASGGNYAKIYNSRGHVRIELTIQNKDHNNILIREYTETNFAQFADLAKRTLVKHLNFCTPSSIRNKRPQQIPSFQQFLGSDVKPVKWSAYQPEIDIPDEEFGAGLFRCIKQLERFSGKHDLNLRSEIATFKQRAMRLFEENRDFEREVALY